MNKNDSVQDNEELYRSVRSRNRESADKEYIIKKGRLIILPAAFRDRYKQPSVDRAKLRDFKPTLSKLSETDGIVSLIAGEVRKIGKVETKVQNGDPVPHAVDVIPDPTPDNPAHSQIVVRPDFFGSKNKQKNAFKLLQIALAKLASKKDWTLEPSNQ